MEKFNSYGEHIQKSNKEVVDSIKVQYQDKIALLKSKIKDQHDQMAELEDEVVKERRVQGDIKNHFEQMVGSMREDMRRIKEEWERRLTDEDLEH